MIELNLLPDVKQQFIRAQRLKRIVIAIAILISLISVGVVALIAFYVFAAQPIRGNLVDGSIKESSKELKDEDNLTRDLTIQNQLSTLTNLHAEKGVYSRLIEYLTTLNPVSNNNSNIINLSKVRLDAAENQITLEASGVDYSAIAVYEDTLRNAVLTYTNPTDRELTKKPLFSNVQISGTTLRQDSSGAQVVAFTASLDYEPEAFSWDVLNPTVTVPKKKTTPSAGQVSAFATNPLKKEEEQ